MPRQLPMRPSSHVLEVNSRRFFDNVKPETWILEEPRRDYGIDLEVRICEEEKVTNFKFLVQLKASMNATLGDFEKVRLKASTFHLLDGELEVALLVKFVESENKAYYILLNDVPAPNENNHEFTIRIPKINILNEEAWKNIRDYVVYVTEGKLSKWKNRIQAG